MRFKGTRPLPGKRSEVWLALNDPKMLLVCIPGCESLSRKPDGSYDAIVVASVGPVKARLAGSLGVKDVVANESYTLQFDLQGGAAGFGRGDVQVRLEDDPGGCVLYYVAEANVGGRIAQLGSRLIEGTTTKLSHTFFERFAAEIATRALAPVIGSSIDSASQARPSSSFPAMYWIGLTVLVAVIVLLVLVVL